MCSDHKAKERLGRDELGERGANLSPREFITKPFPHPSSSPSFSLPPFLLQKHPKKQKREERLPNTNWHLHIKD